MKSNHCFLGFLVTFLLSDGAETQPAQESLKPQRVRFLSQNFHNILHWQPGKALMGNHSNYFVQYKVYGQRQWTNKKDCWGIPELLCDLTNETLDIREPYYGRVRAAAAGISSRWSMSPRFTPWWESKIDPPLMNITQVHGSLLVSLCTPNFPYRDTKGNNASVEDYYGIVYQVFIISNSLEKEQKVYEGKRRVVKIEALPSQSSYCLSAKIYQPMLDKRSARSQERCVGIL
ncbi:PREDICTED: interleukin-22 receptor subunit alpha-2 [Elephantulus edwardii]|uniref:interleukin-22 receptor subunit alpha-2 n=1 Tax=Elephantulus edwardii TaxID=28737 RepID=UPI0003F0D386|nr:PREDICTED: interleukin-22 receptor subunit alpha-2 [Elephantulus edwardii]